MRFMWTLFAHWHKVFVITASGWFCWFIFNFTYFWASGRQLQLLCDINPCSALSSRIILCLSSLNLCSSSSSTGSSCSSTLAPVTCDNWSFSISGSSIDKTSTAATEELHSWQWTELYTYLTTAQTAVNERMLIQLRYFKCTGPSNNTGKQSST